MGIMLQITAEAPRHSLRHECGATPVAIALFVRVCAVRVGRGQEVRHTHNHITHAQADSTIQRQGLSSMESKWHIWDLTVPSMHRDGSAFRDNDLHQSRLC